MSRRLPVLCLLLLIAASFASARVISYAPYSNRISAPAIAHRLNRHFALIETRQAQGTAPSNGRLVGQIVLYDTKGEEEPRVVLPRFDFYELELDDFALREPPGQQAQILAVAGDGWGLSVDAGRTWKQVPVPGAIRINFFFNKVDVGGWYTRGRYSNIRIGSDDYPFVVVTTQKDGYRLVAIAADGSAKQLLHSSTSAPISLAGTDHAGRRFLVRLGTEIAIIDLDGTKTSLGTLRSGQVEGWITGAGTAYVELSESRNAISFWLLNGGATFLEGTYPVPLPGFISGIPFFAVPTTDYNGAWVVTRLPGRPTRLLLHTSQRGLEEQWSDSTAPQVEAIIPAPSADRILIQVHRPRTVAEAPGLSPFNPFNQFKDPALAVWHIGDPAPRSYDELYLSEVDGKGFVHVDVDAFERGEPFVFDSGQRLVSFSGGTISAGGGGGSDVVQEWGVVRGSLRQRLVLPGFGRTGGAFGSLWRSDVTLLNPNDVPVDVTLRFAPTGAPVTVSSTNMVRLQLAAREIRLIPDAAKQLFGLDGSVGALFIEPEGGASVNATGRTYNIGGKGTYGYATPAMDVFATTSRRFPVNFSAAFQGSKFRTNLFLTDVSGRGTSVQLTANGPTGSVEVAEVPEATPNSVMQFNGLGFLPIGALTVAPTRGEAIASLFCVDNITNDPTFFPPDLAASSARTIPAVGHLDGANGSQFRSDLFLYNDTDSPKSLTVEMHSWTSTYTASIFIGLAPHEARMVTDVLKTWFNRTNDMARLRIFSAVVNGNRDIGFRVTARTYAIAANGGTYGFLMPPLNSFQIAAPGDTLEILGTSLDRNFRTNIGVFDLTNVWYNQPDPSVEITIIGANGVTLRSFETTIKSVGGVQLNDIFRARNLALDGSPVLIRITPSRGTIGAYAAMVDGGTNDPMYFAANLAAK